MKNKVENVLEKKYQKGSNTFGSYLRGFKRIHLLMGNGDSFEPYKDFNKVKKVIENMKITKKGGEEKPVSKETKKNTYLSLGMILSLVDGYEEVSKKYREMNMEYIKNINEGLKDNEKSEKQKEKLVDYKVLIDKVKELKKKKKDKYDTYMLCFMYVVPIFTPRNEYRQMKVYYDNNVDDTKNYLLVSKDSIKVVLNEYKTKKKFGKIEYTYDKRVQNEIRKYLEYKKNPSVIFDFSSQNLSTKLTNNLGVSVQFIRTIKNDWYVKQPKFTRMSMKKQTEKMNQLFQHGLFQSLTSYKKKNLN